MKTVEISAQEYPNGIGVLELMTKLGITASNGEARRLVQQGGVSVNDEKVTDPQAKIEITGEVIIKKGKKVFHKVVAE